MKIGDRPPLLNALSLSLSLSLSLFSSLACRFSPRCLALSRSRSLVWARANESKRFECKIIIKQWRVYGAAGVTSGGRGRRAGSAAH